jgi:hypothetical protein
MQPPTSGGGGGTSPSPTDQAQATDRAQRAASEAARSVEVHGADGLEIVGVGPVSFQGDAFDSLAYDETEKQVVVVATVPILAGLAASRPAYPGRPTLYIATDTGAHSTWDGSTWRTI